MNFYASERGFDIQENQKRLVGLGFILHLFILSFLMFGSHTVKADDGESLQKIAGATSAIVIHEVEPESGIESWKTNNKGVFLSLKQITPDRARAFFAARDFPKAASDSYARSCAFETVVRNEGEDAISLHIAEWQAIAKKQELKLKLEPEWQSEWERLKLPQAARIAFRWSQFPLEQHFEKGDWGQGMTTYKLAHGACFDLAYNWSVKGKAKNGILKGVCCAHDR